MQTKPFYSSPLIIVLPVIFLVIDITVMILFDVAMIVEYKIDRVEHVLGGILVGLSSMGLIWHLIFRGVLPQPNNLFLRVVVLGIVCFASICWEILEYIIQLHPQYLTYTDTIMDLICGLIGGLAIAIVIRIPQNIFVGTKV